MQIIVFVNTYKKLGVNFPRDFLSVERIDFVPLLGRALTKC